MNESRGRMDRARTFRSSRPTSSGFHRPVLRIAAVAVVAGLLTGSSGCDGPFGDPDLRLDVPPERLREIDTLRLEEAPAAPVDVDTESAASARALLEPDQSARVTLDLAAARALALANNLDLEVTLIDPTIAQEAIQQEEARFEWLFFANAGFVKNDTPTATTLSGSQVESFSGDLGVRIPLRTGGEIVFDLPVNSVETNNIFATLNPAYETDFTASISQPLLRGAGVRTNTHPIRVAMYQSRIVEARTKLQIINVLATLDRTYWGVYAARRALEVRVQEYELALAQLDRARRQVEVGLLPEVEVIRAESGVAERIEAIIVAENLLRQRERELKRLINEPALDMGGGEIIVPATDPNPVRYDLEAPRLIAAALEQRMELLELELQLAQDLSEIDFRRNAALPLFNIDYRYVINGLGDSWNSSFDLMNDKSFEDHQVGVRLEVPLGNEAAESLLRQAIFRRIQRLASRELREQLVREEVLDAIDEIQTAWQRVLASRQRTILAARTFEAEQRQFDLGLRTSTDVLDAQARLAAAQLAEIQAITDYQVAQVDLAVSTGTLLGAAQVRWDPLVPDTDDLSASRPGAVE